MTENKLKELLNNMTLEEKLCQITQAEPRISKDKTAISVNPESKGGITEEQYYALGSVITYIPEAEKSRRIQEDYLSRSRLKIPLLIMSDVVHGKETVFPIPLAMGCSFNTDLVRNACETAAEEAAASGVHTVFSPVCDLSRDPRWGRVMESYGEDPYLNSQMAGAAVKGFQGNSPDKIDDKHVSSCVKHYLGYGACIGGRDYNTCEISDNELYNYYLRPFGAASAAGVSMAMTSFNTLNGIPMTINSKMLKLLRNKLEFGDGVIISDYNSLQECKNHGISDSDYELASLAFDAGLDIEMMSTTMLENGLKLIENGRINETSLDESVMRILELKNKLGLFENPYRAIDEEKEFSFFNNAKQRLKSRKAAAECAVLLKNNGALPIKRSVKAGLCGPFALSDYVSGEWAFSALHPRNVSLYEGLCNKIGKENICLSNTDMISPVKSGKDSYKTEIPYPNEILNFEGCDAVIVTVGEHMCDSGEAASRHTISLSDNQIELVKKASELNKPVIAVVFSGRPLNLSSIERYCDAIIYAWYLGCEMGNALADLLVGDVNPSGKLAMSLPADIGQIPIYYNYLPTGRPAVENGSFVSGYTDFRNKPLYPFGHGLSYSDFEYSELSVDNRSVFVTVKNNTNVAGQEVVQLYIRDLFAKISRPVKELKGFKKIALAPNESKTVTFELTDEMLSYYFEGEELLDSGEFEIFVGTSSDNCLKTNLII